MVIIFEMATNVDHLFYPSTDIHAPQILDTVGDLSKNWCKWRINFLLFMKAEDPQESCKERWWTFLLMFIGPLGQEAYKKLNFQNDEDKSNIDCLLQKFDLHFIFGNREKQPAESVMKYIDELQKMAERCSHPAVYKIVKDKVLFDIFNHNWNDKCQELINSLKGTPSSNLKSLELSEMIHIWNSCEKLMSNETNQGTIAPTYTTLNGEVEIHCIRCDQHHPKNKCPAQGKRCSKCKNLNHFQTQCKAAYVKNCVKCGTHHIQSSCPAFGSICSKCGKLNHFSSKCQISTNEKHHHPKRLIKNNPSTSTGEKMNLIGQNREMYVNNCPKCGTIHQKSHCPAFGSICSKCGKANHFASKCQIPINEKHSKQSIKDNPSTSTGEKMNLVGPNRETYVNNCPKCGTVHQKSHCPAFGSICSKCGKANHFASKCRTLQVENCSRCGQNHLISACPAVGKLCPLCKKPNHSENKCIYKVKSNKD